MSHSKTTAHFSCINCSLVPGPSPTPVLIAANCNDPGIEEERGGGGGREGEGRE